MRADVKAKAKYQQMKNELDNISHHINVERNEIRNLEHKQRVQKLIRAGLVFEEAGILDEFDHDEILNLLLWHKEVKA